MNPRRSLTLAMIAAIASLPPEPSERAFRLRTAGPVPLIPPEPPPVLHEKVIPERIRRAAEKRARKGNRR